MTFACDQRRRRPGLAWACALTLCTTFGANAQTELDDRWHGDISVGGALASGNAESRTLSAKAEVVKANPRDTITLNGVANQAQGTVNGVSTTTSNRLALGGRYDYNLTPTVFAFGGGDAETNRAGGLRSRYAANAGAGYKLVLTDSTRWDVFAGVGYARVEYTNDTSARGAELLLGEQSSHEISESTTAKQRVVLRPGGSGLGTLVTLDASLATAISGGWTLNTGLLVRYASRPAAGQERTDTLLTFGFGYKF